MGTTKRRERLIHQVREIAQDLSGVPLESVAENATFLELGFDSLFLTQLSAACQKAFRLRITFRQLFTDLPTIAALGSYLDEKLPAEAVVSASDAKEDLPMPVEKTPIPVAAVAGPAVPAPVQISAPVQMQPSLDAAAPFVPLALGEEAVPVAGMESVLLRQLELMGAQLRLLQGIPADTAVRVSATQASLVSACGSVARPAGDCAAGCYCQ